MSTGLLDAIANAHISGKDGNLVSLDKLEENDLIGLYFSAHWCPPCRAFTPQLRQCYESIVGQNGKFAIIFVSSDKDEDSFKDYYDDMPWFHLPFSEREKKDQLGQKYGVKGIPTLILLDNAGNVVDKEGRSRVAKDLKGENFPWGLCQAKKE